MVDPCDRQRSPGRWKAVPEGSMIRFHLEVRGLGVLIVSMGSEPTDPKGKLSTSKAALLLIPAKEQ